MSKVEAADIYVLPRGRRCCTLWLDEDDRDIGCHCLIDDVLFKTVIQHIEFKDSRYGLRHPHLCVDLEGGSYVGDWFIGKEVRPA